MGHERSATSWSSGWRWTARLDAAGATQLVQVLELGGFLEPVPVGLKEGLERDSIH